MQRGEVRRLAGEDSDGPARCRALVLLVLPLPCTYKTDTCPQFVGVYQISKYLDDYIESFRGVDGIARPFALSRELAALARRHFLITLSDPLPSAKMPAA